MITYVFVAHDPGGCDAIWPIRTKIDEINKGGGKTITMLAGFAGDRYPEFRAGRKNIMERVGRLIEGKEKFILVTGTSWPTGIELDVIRLCRANNIPTVSVLDYWQNYIRRFETGAGIVFPDFLFVMDDLARREAIAEGIEASIIKVVGHPGLDYYVKNKVIGRKEKSILFLSQPLSALYGDSLGYTEFGVFQDILDMGKEMGFEAHIKFHPRETEKMRKVYGIYSVEGKVGGIVHNYGVVIGMTTMGLLQCALMGIPVISYQPNLKAVDSCITNKLGITEGAFCYNDLAGRLLGLRKYNMAQMPFWFDGNSTKRCIEELSGISRGYGVKEV